VVLWILEVVVKTSYYRQLSGTEFTSEVGGSSPDVLLLLKLVTGYYTERDESFF